MMKILIADDHPVVRHGLKKILATDAELTVVGEAKNSQEAADLARKIEWDVAILDYSMPGRSGIELIKQVKGEKPKLRILILSMHQEEQYAVRALKAGASGYLTKSSAPEELIFAIHKVSQGEKYISAPIAEELANRLISELEKPNQWKLSAREWKWVVDVGTPSPAP
jgi:DNA-binding NarL/FixJ family response regulator